ncbi:MAG: hypothetical protein E7371_05565 [Clostridiales bacterium]|nr:hypothetical protein [Clostridiales bacterium]
MAKVKKAENALVIKKSFWSAISVWWQIIVFLIAVPAGGIVCGLLVFGLDDIIGIILLAVGAASFVIDLLGVIYEAICAARTSWTFYDGSVIYRKGRLFYIEERTYDMEFFPGMAVTARYSPKANFFKYGHLTVTNGAGEAGEIVMEGAKHARKHVETLRKLLAVACTRTANMMSPYKMYPQMYRNVLGGYPAYYYGAMQMNNMNQNNGQ